jgi:hypothetical protein
MKKLFVGAGLLATSLHTPAVAQDNLGPLSHFGLPQLCATQKFTRITTCDFETFGECKRASIYFTRFAPQDYDVLVDCDFSGYYYVFSYRPV